MNSTMPYQYKKKVLQAAIQSSLTYGCESWLIENYKDVEQKYIGALRALVGVREATPANLILLETGMPTLKEIVRQRTVKFVKKNIRGDKEDTPLAKSYRTCQNKGTKGYRYIKGLLDNPNCDTLDNLKEKFSTETGTRAKTYRSINPDLQVHTVYTSTEYIEENKRITFTRFRLSSHRLKVETGRWSRIPRENRLCGCGSGQIQDEMLFDCIKTKGIRDKYTVNKQLYKNVGELMEKYEYMKLVNFIEDCMNLF